MIAVSTAQDAVASSIISHSLENYAIGYSLDHPDSNQETANRIINSISFQCQ